jgi:hypothetical protein
VANLTIPRVDESQEVRFENGSNGTSDVLGDVLGYFTVS